MSLMKKRLDRINTENDRFLHDMQNSERNELFLTCFRELTDYYRADMQTSTQNDSQWQDEFYYEL